jgi:hypothetical protein
MVRGRLLILLIAALNLARLAREHIRKPSVPSQVDGVLTHSVLPDLDPFPPQRIRLMTGSTRPSLSLVNNAQQQQQQRNDVNRRD